MKKSYCKLLKRKVKPLVFRRKKDLVPAKRWDEPANWECIVHPGVDLVQINITKYYRVMACPLCHECSEKYGYLKRKRLSEDKTFEMHRTRPKRVVWKLFWLCAQYFLHHVATMMYSPMQMTSTSLVKQTSSVKMTGDSQIKFAKRDTALNNKVKVNYYKNRPALNIFITRKIAMIFVFNNKNLIIKYSKRNKILDSFNWKIYEDL